MRSDFLEQALGNQVTIPTLPAVVQRINTLMADPEIGLRDLGREIAKDAPIATKVLRIANSAFYGLREKVVSTELAASVLGLRVLKNIVLQASVMAQFEHLAGKGGFDLDAQWSHSIQTARLAQELIRASGKEFALGPDEFYSCGLLHDIGKVVLLDNLTRDYLAVVEKSRRSGRELYEVEDEELGFDHAAIGARVAERWGLPKVLVDAIGRHHDPIMSIVRDEPAAAVVSAANAISHRLCANDQIESLESVQGLPLAPLGLDGARASEVVEGVRNTVDV